MSDLVEIPGWDTVPQLEVSTPALGGPGGPMNAQAQALANRLALLALRWYGNVSLMDHFVGDITTDDIMPALQTAIAATPTGGHLWIPPGRTYQMTLATLGAACETTGRGPMTIHAEGAKFKAKALSAAHPVTGISELTNAFIRFNRCEGIVWLGGEMDGSRDDAIPPLAAFLAFHGCKRIRVRDGYFYDWDHNFGAVMFDAVRVDGVTVDLQEDNAVEKCRFKRCYAGAQNRGSSLVWRAVHNSFVDGDLQDPQWGYPRPYAFFTGSISGTTLTVSGLSRGSLQVNHVVHPVTNATVPGFKLQTTIVSQLTGTPGGNGTYQVDRPQPVASVAMLSGTPSYAVSFWSRGFDGEGSTSVAGYQDGIDISWNYVDGATQGPNGYNYNSNNYTSTSTYEAKGFRAVNNTLRRFLTGIHMNGFDSHIATGNDCNRANLSDADLLAYGGKVKGLLNSGWLSNHNDAGDPVQASGTCIEGSTAVRDSTITGNTCVVHFPRDGATNPSTDYSGGSTCIAFGATTGTRDQKTKVLIGNNNLSGAALALLGTGNVCAVLDANRISGCLRDHENQASPLQSVAAVTATISGNTLTVTALTGGSLDIGQTISDGPAAGRYITAYGTGLGGTGPGALGTYTISGGALTVGSPTAMILTGAYPEGVYSNNVSTRGDFTGAKTARVFRGSWSIFGNKTFGDKAHPGDFGMVLDPGKGGKITVDLDRDTNVAEGYQIIQSDYSTVIIDGAKFDGLTEALDLNKNALSTLGLLRCTFENVNTALFFRPGGTHGTYFGQDNTLRGGSWTNDEGEGAVFPTSLGYATAAPTSGHWARGNSYANPFASIGAGERFVCDVGGNPGTWRRTGHVGGTTTVASLPAAAADLAGMRAMVSDANSTTFMSTVAGGGSNKVPVVCDGTAWKIG